MKPRNTQPLTLIDGDQIELMGHQVVLSDIRSAILNLSFPNIEEVMMVAYENDAKTVICALIKSSYCDTSAVRKELVKALPEYMKPELIRVDQLPLTPNGEIDQIALFSMLPLYEGENGPDCSGAYDSLKNFMQSRLRLDKLPSDENFFQFGLGDLDMQAVIQELNKRFNVQLKPLDLLQNPTLDRLYKLIQNQINLI